MKSLIQLFFTFIAKAHGFILTLNDANEASFNDKELHFLVIGIFGMVLLMIIFPLFKMLSKNHIMAIAFIYVLTVVVGFTFAIEIGQKMTGSGSMELVDIEFGILGFLLMFGIFAIVRAIFLAVSAAFKKLMKK